MRRGVLLLLCTMVAARLAAQGGSSGGLTVETIGATDRAQNPEILRLLERSDVGEQLRIADALALRKDPYVVDILEYLATTQSREARYAAELVLRRFLEGMFLAPTGADRTARDRVQLAIAENRRALDPLVDRLASVSDPLLRRDLVLLLPPLRGASAPKLLAEEGRFLIGLLRAGGGALAPDRIQEAIACLGAGAGYRDPVLREQAITIASLSTDRDVVAAARAAL